MWFIILLWIACVNARLLVGKFIPQLDSQGHLFPKQCHGSTGFCWCVSADGQRVGEAAGPGVLLVCSH